jgi:hypothetical protein
MVCQAHGEKASEEKTETISKEKIQQLVVRSPRLSEPSFQRANPPPLLKRAVFLVVAGTHLPFQRLLQHDPSRKTVILWIYGDRIMRTLPQ